MRCTTTYTNKDRHTPNVLGVLVGAGTGDTTCGGYGIRNSWTNDFCRADRSF